MTFAEIDIPKIIPTMTLSKTVLFPQSVLHLYIFEKRYKRMIADVISNHRILVVANRDDKGGMAMEEDETPHTIATAGIVRIANLNKDGTSNVMLQGLSRVKIEDIISENPYRETLISPAYVHTKVSHINFAKQQQEFIKLLRERERLGIELPEEVSAVFENLKNTNAIADLASNAFCKRPRIRQVLLETQLPEKRMQLLIQYMKVEINELILRKDLSGDLSDWNISSN